VKKSEAPLISIDPQDLDEIWRMFEANVAEDRFRKLLGHCESHASQDQSTQIEILTQIARAEGAQKRFSEALANLARAEELLEGGQSSYRVSAKIRWLLEKGRLYVLQRTPSQARPHFAEAWTLASHSGEDAFAVDVAMMLATIEPPKAQQDWLMRAIRLAEESPQAKAKAYLGSLYAAMGWKLFDVRQYEQALELFQKSLSHFKLRGTNRELFVAKWSVGKLLRTMGKPEEALIIQNALLAELGIGGPKDGRLYEELAECLHSLKRSAEAQSYFELAYLELSTDEWIVDNQPAMLKRLKELGKAK
jgi:tetratricopeptide (TPR) repeat protein